MLVNFYGVSRLLLFIWDIEMVCEVLYTHMGNSVVPLKIQEELAGK